MPTRNELAAKSAPPATGRGSGDVEKQDLAASVGNGNGSSNPATETTAQQPSLTGLPFLLLFSSVILAVLQIALNATITSTVSKSPEQTNLFIVVIRLTRLLMR